MHDAAVHQKRDRLFLPSAHQSVTAVWGMGGQGGDRAFGVARCSGEASPQSVFHSGRHSSRHRYPVLFFGFYSYRNESIGLVRAALKA